MRNIGKFYIGGAWVDPMSAATHTLINPADETPIAETLLFYAARAEHWERLIKPALAEGKTVLCDRFADSTVVYQGAGRQLPEQRICRSAGQQELPA